MRGDSYVDQATENHILAVQAALSRNLPSIRWHNLLNIENHYFLQVSTKAEQMTLKRVIVCQYCVYSVFVQLLKVKKNTAIGHHPPLARFRWIFPGFYKCVCNFLILFLYIKNTSLCKFVFDSGKTHSDIVKTLNASKRFSLWSTDRQKLPHYCGSPCTSNHA